MIRESYRQRATMRIGMGVYLKQDNADTISVRPGSLVTVLANNCPTFSNCNFRMYADMLGAAGPPWVYWAESAKTNWKGEAYLDNVPASNQVGAHILDAECNGFSARWQFKVSTGAPTPSNPDDSRGAPGVAGSPDWQLVMDTVTPEAATYTGKAKRVPFEFSVMPEQFDFVNKWLVNNLLNNIQKEATKNNGSKVLKLKLWRDTSPTWETKYKGELELTTPGGFEMPFLVVVIIVAALAGIVYYFIVKPLIGQVIDLVYGPVDPDTGKRPGNALVSYTPWIIAGVAAILVLPKVFGNKQGSK